jgi:oxalate decarboxylase
MSSTMAAALITLAPGDIREPHWHPNSDEWLMVMHGKISMTVVNGKGESSHFTCGPNDVASTPQGFGHYVENISDGETLVLVVHNHAEFTTVNLSEWVAGGSNSVFTTALGLPSETFDEVPKKRAYITRRKKKAK